MATTTVAQATALTYVDPDRRFAAISLQPVTRDLFDLFEGDATTVQDPFPGWTKTVVLERVDLVLTTYEAPFVRLAHRLEGSA